MRKLLSQEVLILFILAVFIAPVFLFGLFYPDEGYMLHTASRLLQGEVMYRDFDFVYTPLSAWIPVGFFLVFGKSVLAGRVAAYILAIVSIVALFGLLRMYTRNIRYILLAVFIYLAWGPSHINFVWPSMVSITCSLLACLFFVKSEKNNNFFIAVGICSALAILAKQNIGIAVAVMFLLLVIVENWKTGKKIPGPSSFYLAGFFGSLAVFLLFLFLQGSVTAFFRNNYLNLFQKILLEGTIATPLLYGRSFYSIVKLLFYLSPLLLCIPAGVLAVKHKSSAVVLPMLCFIVYLAGIRPVTDYVHLSPLLALGGLPVFVLCLYARKKVYLLTLFLYAVFMIALGVYSPLFLYYYRWQEPLVRQTFFVDQKHALVFTEKKYTSEIPELTRYIDSISRRDSYVYINYYAPMVYFLLDRRNPTRYDYVSGSALTDREQQDIVRSLEEKKVSVAITHAIVQQDTSPAYAYIASQFVMKKRIGDLIIWQRRSK